MEDSYFKEIQNKRIIAVLKRTKDGYEHIALKGINKKKLNKPYPSIANKNIYEKIGSTEFKLLKRELQNGNNNLIATIKEKAKKKIKNKGKKVKNSFAKTVDFFKNKKGKSFKIYPNSSRGSTRVRGKAS